MNKFIQNLPINEPLIIYLKKGMPIAGLNIETITYTNNDINLTGWVFGCIDLIVTNLNKKLPVKVLKYPREDVANTHKLNSDLKCEGFSIEIPKASTNDSNMALRFEYKKNKTLETLTFILPKSDSTSDYLNKNSINFLGASADIEKISKDGISGWVALRDYYGRSIRCDLIYNESIISTGLGSISRDDLIDNLNAKTAFNFYISLQRINVEIIKKINLDSNGLSIRFTNINYLYPINGKQSIEIIKAIEIASKYFEINSRGKIEITATSIKKVDRETPFIRNKPKVKAIAFYLPQFHSISENDEWWGKSFTEWVNVTQARPAFSGHHQPHIPSNLGFYDASEEKTILKQIELAEKYGVYSFCFHYYWFNGKRLLTKPIDTFINTKHDFKFMLCWANENWTRRWDGLEEDVLLHQEHNFSEDINFIDDILPYILDERYITRSDGSKWIIVYRANLLKNSVELFEIWRKKAAEYGISLHISTIDGFKQTSEKYLGIDSYIQFPPGAANSANKINDRFKFNDGFQDVTVYDYDDIKTSSIADYCKYISQKSTIPLTPGVMPGWDNSARKKGKASIVYGNTPNIFYEWVKKVCEIQKTYLNSSDDQYIFINAWNEWAEGAHLEPDIHNEERYLIALNQGILNSSINISSNLAYDHMIKDINRCGGFNTAIGTFDISFFSKFMPKIIERSPFAKRSLALISKHWIDSINGRPLENNGVDTQYIQYQSGLNLVGWIIVPFKLQHKHPIFFCLNSETGERYWTISSKTYPRDDLNKYMANQNDNLDNIQDGVGFQLNATLDNMIEPGKYELEAYIVVNDNKNKYFTIDFHICSVEIF